MNDLQLRFLKAKSKKYTVSDNGLIISIYPTGKITFSSRIMQNGKRQYITIGDYPEISLADAHKFIDNYKTSISDNKKINFKSFGIVTEKFESENKQIQSSIFKAIKKIIFPHYENSQCENIKPFVIKELIDKSDLTDCNKYILVNTIKRILNYSVLLGYAEFHKCQNINLLYQYKTQQHQKSIDYRNLNEIQSFYDVLNKRAKTLLSCIIMLALRQHEAINLRFSWIDKKNNCFIIPAEFMKMKREFRVPITPVFQKILDGCDKNFDSIYGYRKPTTCTLSYFSTREKFKYTFHGFRATFRTWCADNNVRFEVAEMCLSHQEKSSVVRAYSRSDYLEERREVMQKYQEYVLSKLKL